MPRGIYKRKPFTEKHKGNIRKSLQGHLTSEETRKKIGLANSITQKGMKKPWVAKENRKKKGIKKSTETKKKMSEARLKEKNPMFGMKREKNPNWKNGATSKNRIARESWDYDNWRKEVFTRDNWTCQNCEAKGGKLHSHHIYNFADNIDLRFIVENGITLCKNCHNEFHKIYGKKNNNAIQLIEFLKSAQKQELLEGIKGLWCKVPSPPNRRRLGYNQAISDIIQLLK